MLTVSRLQITRCGRSVLVMGRRGVATTAETEQHRKEREERERREEEQATIRVLDRMSRMETPSDFDIKVQTLAIFDLRFPVPISLAPPGLKGKYEWLYDKVVDRYKSITGFRQAYKVGMTPKPRFHQFFTLNSKPFAESALSIYANMNSSFARGDLRSLAKVCSEEQLDKLRQRIKTRPKGQNVVWGRDEKGESAKVLSVRTVDAWGTGKPEDACSQALVRFDTQQSLAVYGPTGKLLSGDPNKLVPVREYFVLENKNWLDGGWMVRKLIQPNQTKISTVKIF